VRALDGSTWVAQGTDWEQVARCGLAVQVTEQLETQSLSLTGGGGLHKEEFVGLDSAPGMAMKRHPGLCTLVESCALRYMLNEHTPAFAEALEPFRCAAPLGTPLGHTARSTGTHNDRHQSASFGPPYP